MVDCDVIRGFRTIKKNKSKLVIQTPLGQVDNRNNPLAHWKHVEL